MVNIRNIFYLNLFNLIEVYIAGIVRFFLYVTIL